MKEIIEGEVADSGPREGDRSVVPAALGGDRSDSGDEGSPTATEPKASGRHAQLPGQPLSGKAEAVAQALARGMTPAEAQAALGLTARSWSRITGERETARRVCELAGQSVRLSAGKAVATISALLVAESDRIRLDAAREILERSGVGTGDKSTTSPVTVVIEL